MRRSLVVAVLPLVLLAACSSSDAATDTTVAITEPTPTVAPGRVDDPRQHRGRHDRGTCTTE